MSLLKDRIIVITGAGRGLGRAFAEDCCRQGAEVVIAEKNIEWGQQCELELRNAGHTATFFPVDIADPDSVKTLSTDLSKTAKRSMDWSTMPGSPLALAARLLRK